MTDDARLDAITRHPGYAAAIAQRPSRRFEWGWLVVDVLMLAAGGLLVAGPFLRPERFDVVTMIVFIAMGLVLLAVGILGWRVQWRRLAEVTAAPAIVQEVQAIVIGGKYPRREQLVALRVPGGVHSLRDRHDRPLRVGDAGVAHLAGDILLAFTPLEG